VFWVLRGEYGPIRWLISIKYLRHQLMRSRKLVAWVSEHGFALLCPMYIYRSSYANIRSQNPHLLSTRTPWIHHLLGAKEMASASTYKYVIAKTHGAHSTQENKLTAIPRIDNGSVSAKPNFYRGLQIPLPTSSMPSMRLHTRMHTPMDMSKRKERAATEKKI
jgi:hypothetical protein